jgi:hypothetical protein
MSLGRFRPLIVRHSRALTLASGLFVLALLATLVIRSASAADDAPATKDVTAEFFNGKDLSNWDAQADIWRVEDGELVGQSKTGLKSNDFAKNKMTVKDFRLTVKIKLVPDAANSGIQFRSVPIEKGEMRGYQADAGKGWWGTLYHESGRKQLYSKLPPEGTVKTDDWNTYEVVAVGHHILTAINGVPCVDLEDPKGELEGLLAVQVHSGGPTEVRFKDFKLEVDPKCELVTVKK